MNFSRRLRNQPQKGVTGDAFPRPRFADDADCLSSIQRKRDVLYRMNDPCPGMESGSQVFNLEYGHGGILYAPRGMINDQHRNRRLNVDGSVPRAIAFPGTI